MINHRTLSLTALAMLAFAANSLLCRAALGPRFIDPASFTSIRLASGAAMLVALSSLSGRTALPRGLLNHWKAPLMLFTYMICFSFAYLSLSAGTGALLLFGAVQLTIFGWAMYRREHLPPLTWAGLALAVAGLVYLVLPGVTAPDPLGALLMVVAGIGWGFYTLLGRGQDPTPATTANFVLALPLTVVASLIIMAQSHLSRDGILLALASGAITSGCGYAIWYAAMKGLTSAQAGIVQLSVPAIAAAGGTWMLSETLSTRLLLASAAILGGVAMALLERNRAAA